MAFAELEDLTGSLRLTLFPHVFRDWLGQIQEGQLCMVEGHLDGQEKRTMVVERMILLRDLVSDTNDPVYIRIPGPRSSPHALRQLKNLLLQHRGHQPVILYYEEKERAIKLDDPYQVKDSSQLREAVERLLGAGTYACGTKGGASSQRQRNGEE